MEFDSASAIAIIAISAVNGIGIIAIGVVNSVGVVAISPVNAIGFLSLATVNSTGVIAFSSVNANGAIAISSNNANGYIAIGRIANGTFAISGTGKGKAKYMISPNRVDDEAVRFFKRWLPHPFWPKPLQEAA